jgi:Protein of unknown function (DUF1579)
LSESLDRPPDMPYRGRVQEGKKRMTHAPDSPERRLATLVGRWRTEGRTIQTQEAPAAPIDAVDTYEWLPGGQGLLHTVDARVGDDHVEGAEIIGWDSTLDVYVTLYCGTDGLNRYEATLAEEEGRVVWRMRSARDRFTGVFSNDGNTIDGHWEQLDDEEAWRPWMNITLTKSAS